MRPNSVRRRLASTAMASVCGILVGQMHSLSALARMRGALGADMLPSEMQLLSCRSVAVNAGADCSPKNGPQIFELNSGSCAENFAISDLSKAYRMAVRVGFKETPSRLGVCVDNLASSLPDGLSVATCRACCSAFSVEAVRRHRLSSSAASLIAGTDSAGSTTHSNYPANTVRI